MEESVKRYRAALYMRLSKEDEGNGESSSIITQRKMLRAFAHENNFPIYDEYIDDGVSGTTFERPEFIRMKNDIEAGEINLVITKDLSRLGRDYISTGNLTEIYFPSKGVRYIAVNDGYDSESSYTDIAPFRNIINEMYARDTSRKIKSSFEVKMKAGEFVGNFAPYGYKKDPNNKNRLIVDKESAPIVQEMFELAAKGCRPSQIAEAFNSRGIATPAVYRCLKKTYLNIENYSQRKEWTSSIICKMLKNIVYLGHMAQGKTSKVSFKSSLILPKPKEEWIIVKDTHEPLISSDTFNLVRSRSVARTNSSQKGGKNLFSGIAKCMDCGRNMSSAGVGKKGTVEKLVCGGYKLYGTKECSNHFIDYEILYDIVLQEIRRQVYLTEEDKNDIMKALEENYKNQKKKNDGQTVKKNISLLRRRERELDKIIWKLYEDNLSGRISNERLQRMVAAYQQEDYQNRQKLTELLEEADDARELYLKNYFKQIEEMSEVKELTREFLHRVVDRIEIGQGAYDESHRKHQLVRIYYKFIGNPYHT